MHEKKRLLFIGEINSSHAQSWIRMVLAYDDEFEIHALNLSHVSWNNAPIPVVSIYNTPDFSEDNFTPVINMSEQEWNHYIPQDVVLNSQVLYNAQQYIDAFCPHVIHTFGTFPSAVFYAHVVENTSLNWKAEWVLQTRGGSDFAVAYYEPRWQSFYEQIFSLADAVICDNERNFSILKEIGVKARRHPVLSLAPGTGGVNVNDEQYMPVNKRDRIVIWPKAYDTPFTKNLPVLEGIRIALERLGSVKFILIGADNAIRDEISRFPVDVRNCFELHEHIPRDEFLELCTKARVMLAPSLVDGIPNVLYEAMTAGLVPIVSPLATMTPHFEDGKQVLYARNLYPDEIANALVKAMNDDTLAENIIRYNAEHVPFFARRPDIQQKVRELYLELSEGIDPKLTVLGQAKSRFIQMKSELLASQSELATTQSELQSALTATQSELTATQSALTATQSELTATQSALTATQSELAATHSALTATQSELAATHSALTATQSELAATQSALTATQSELAATQSALTATQSELAATQSGLTITQSELAATQSELTATHSELAATHSELTATHSELAATHSELTATQSELAATQSELAATQSELAATHSALIVTQSKLTATQSELAGANDVLNRFVIRVQRKIWKTIKFWQ